MALPKSPDQDGLLEYSVVYTDRALNHMSKQFQVFLQPHNHSVDPSQPRVFGRCAELHVAIVYSMNEIALPAPVSFHPRAR